MKRYSLEAIIDGRLIKINKTFKTRSSAMNYIFNLYAKNYIYGLEVTDDFYINGNIHNIEYVLDYSNRFRICRI